MGMIFNIQTKCITWISLYKQYYTTLKLLFYKLQSKYCLQLHRYPLLTHKCWMPSFPRCTLFNEHIIAVEDHLPPNKKHTLEDKLALGSLSVQFLGNSALTESASGAITYPGRNSIAKSREIDSGIGWGLASGVEVEIELWGSEGGEVEGGATELCGSTEGQPSVTRLSLYLSQSYTVRLLVETPRRHSGKHSVCSLRLPCVLPHVWCNTLSGDGIECLKSCKHLKYWITLNTCSSYIIW